MSVPCPFLIPAESLLPVALAAVGAAFGAELVDLAAEPADLGAGFVGGAVGAPGAGTQFVAGRREARAGCSREGALRPA